LNILRVLLSRSVTSEQSSISEGQNSFSTAC
jgi:hypothetical protein